MTKEILTCTQYLSQILIVLPSWETSSSSTKINELKRIIVLQEQSLEQMNSSDLFQNIHDIAKRKKNLFDHIGLLTHPPQNFSS